MAIGQGSKKGWQYLDEARCFDAWNEGGTVKKAHQIIVNETWINPETGQEEYRWRNPETGGEPSSRAVEVAAVRYALRNMEIAREKIIASYGGDWAEDWIDYLKWLMRRVRNGVYRNEYKIRVAEILALAKEKLTEEEFEDFLEFYESLVLNEIEEEEREYA